MNLLKISRRLSVGIGIFASLAVIGGVIVTAAFLMAGVAALTCLMAGVVLTCFIWWRETKHEPQDLFYYLGAFSFAMAAGLALYANLVFALWAAGIAVETGAARNGVMGSYYWMGPVALLYAIFAYALYRFLASKNAGERKQ